ncbi:arginase [Limimonas halophila]|uniref:Arginase n=1 Tax=Limimonas halophila TaxID=1082479 RepID=A0A1G7URZ5_9PROT|nr:arginase [Limimonas halophila]SDG50385.1 arginase [Limimonas halophila]
MTPPADDHRSIALIGAPGDVAAAHRGASMGPEALRVAGMTEALAEIAGEVVDWGNLTGPSHPGHAPVDGLRHLPETATWCRGVRDTVGEALATGRIPVLMGGDHALSMGSLAAASAHCRAAGKPLRVLWLDAHADFNTPETSVSGNLHGMPVAVAAGLGPPELTGLSDATPMVPAARFHQIGVRAIDRLEKRTVAAHGLPVADMREIDERSIRPVMEEALAHATAEGAHLHVSFDVDMLDSSVAPGVGTRVKGGPTYREAQLCMEMIHDTGLLASLDVVELNPAFDVHNATAETAVEMVKSLFGERILSRRPQ